MMSHAFYRSRDHDHDGECSRQRECLRRCLLGHMLVQRRSQGPTVVFLQVSIRLSGGARESRDIISGALDGLERRYDGLGKYEPCRAH